MRMKATMDKYEGREEEVKGGRMQKSEEWKTKGKKHDMKDTERETKRKVSGKVSRKEGTQKGR